MTIHSEHPFVPPEAERDQARRLRSRLGGTVTLWTTGDAAAASPPASRAGLTVSSLMVATGEPAHILALLDPDSDFVARLTRTRTAVVQLLEWPHRALADAFAGVAPAPGGPFKLAEWRETYWGPVLSDASSWAGVRLAGLPRAVGWSVLVDGEVESIEIGEEAAPLVHRRGRYQRPTPA